MWVVGGEGDRAIEEVGAARELAHGVPPIDDGRSGT